MRNGNVLKMRVSEIRVKQIRVNQGLGVFAIHSSSRHEKRFRIMEIFFYLFQCSRNIGCLLLGSFGDDLRFDI